jgi:hypothetical protein
VIILYIFPRKEHSRTDYHGVYSVHPQLTDLYDFWCTSRPYELCCCAKYFCSRATRGRARRGVSFGGREDPETMKAHNLAYRLDLGVISPVFKGLSYELIFGPPYFDPRTP